MSDDLQFVKEIYANLVGAARFDEWDWEPVATKAFEVAEVFNRIAEQRRIPPTVSAGEVPLPPPPDQTPVNAPPGASVTTLTR
jgi:hypothetical protein